MQLLEFRKLEYPINFSITLDDITFDFSKFVGDFAPSKRFSKITLYRSRTQAFRGGIGRECNNMEFRR